MKSALKALRRRVRAFARRRLESRHLSFHLALLSALLFAPGVGSGLFLDDYFHRAAFLTPPEFTELERSPLDLFAFFGERWTLNSGVRAWWAAEDLQLAFFRPVTGLTHWLDYRLWPDAPVLMHAQSIVWMALTAFAAAWLYRRLAAPGALWIAGLAALAFAVDDSHGMPGTWIANRNAVVGCSTRSSAASLGPGSGRAACCSR